MIIVSILAALGLAAPLSALHMRETGRRRPMLRNSKRGHLKLDAALDKHLDDKELALL